MIVFITGASCGFGRAIAKHFANNGHKIIALARRKEKLESLREEIGKAHIIPCDICDKESLKIHLNALPREYQDIDVLVNNDGLALGLEKAYECNFEDWEQMIA
ncbi:MAG: SDR family NAD(P)-dependent oxidoreductase, partial [Helicobacter sp.]|nr:SDR family NAD(P)-dependent oxidoreductase [Helicobacter sp.]